MATIEVRDLTREYAGGRGIHQLTFTARPGRVTGLIGPNGSGKSTTMRSLIGLIRADGQVTYDGLPYAEAVRRPGGVGVQLDVTAAHPRRTARAHLAVLAASQGVSRDRVAAALEEVGLREVADRRVSSYSMGMRQRLGLAGAVVANPRTLLLDEPTNGLDPHGVRWLRERLATLARGGATVLVSSHALGDLEQVVDDLVILADGRVRATGTLEEVVRDFAAERVHLRVEPGAPAIVPALRARGGTVDPRPDGLLVVSGLPLEAVGRIAHTAGAVVLELSRQTGSLNDAYLAACGTDLGLAS